MASAGTGPTNGARQVEGVAKYMVTAEPRRDGHVTWKRRAKDPCLQLRGGGERAKEEGREGPLRGEAREADRAVHRL
jgi:hypothetical protein